MGSGVVGAIIGSNCEWPLRAILSDIHGNLEALTAVLADASSFGVNSVYCLGDMVGYGPDQVACVERSMEFDLVLAGNYESALLRPEPMEEIWPTMVIAGRSLMRLRDQLTDWRHGEEFLRSLSPSYERDGTMYVHGSPREPGEYLCPEDIYNLQKMEKVWAAFELLCFCGHTHIPGVMTTSEFVTPDECGLEVPVDRKLICNVGSVGQPGDGDSRACYVLFDGQTIRFRRVPYDYEKTIAKIRDNGDDDFSGTRLRDGR